MCCLYHIINFFWVFTTHFYHSWLLWVWLVFQKTVSTPQYYLCILREHKAEQHQRWCHDGHDVHSESTPSIRIICIYHKRVCIKCLHLSEWVNVKCECVCVCLCSRMQDFNVIILTKSMFVATSHQEKRKGKQCWQRDYWSLHRYATDTDAV